MLAELGRHKTSAVTTPSPPQEENVVVKSCNRRIGKTNDAIEALHSGKCLRAVVKY